MAHSHSMSSAQSTPEYEPQHTSLIALFEKRAAAKADQPFLFQKSSGTWQSISWGDARRQVAALAEALRKIGLQDGDRVILLSENRPEWCIADLAIMAAGCITVPTYTSNMSADNAHILDNSGARAVVVSSAKLMKNLAPALQMAGIADHVIAMDAFPFAQATGYHFHRWAELISAHSGQDNVYLAQVQKLTRKSRACIIYTSGTGGKPRGVIQSHGSILHNAEGAAQILQADFPATEKEIFLSFLPLSHAYEHTGGQFWPIALGAEIHYAQGLDKLSRNIEEVGPTIMVVVPRLFEVLRMRIIQNVQKQGGLALRLLGYAQNMARRKNEGKSALYDPLLSMLLEKTLRPKMRAKFGGRLKAMVSGGAPLNPEIGYFFQSVGLILLQGYGQTESGPIISCNRPSCGLKMHTVGPPLMNTQVKIAADGEILARGEMVMEGYWRNEKETAKVLIDGWLHTGDIGHLDEKGRVVITDRKKDLIVSDKGDNIAPQRIEGMLTLEAEIGQAMIYGDQKPYLTAIVSPDAEWSKEWAEAHNIPYDMPALLKNTDYCAAVRSAVDRVNSRLSVIEKVRTICFGDEAFCVENGEMTPSLKIRRHIIRARYQERLDALYKS